MKKVFESYCFFVITKGNKKADALRKISSTSNISVKRLPQSPISKSMPHYSVPTFFFQRMSQSPGQDQYNGMQT